jgi:VWFA-related protein
MKSIRISSLLAIIAAAATAQSNDITTNIIVKDKKGVSIKGLTSADFEVTDGGAKPAKVDVRLVDGGSNPKLITMVFEGLDNEKRRLAKQIAYDLVQEGLAAGQQFAVVKFTNQICLLLPFSSDLKAIQEAVDFAISGNFGPTFVKAHNENLAKLQVAQDPLSRTQVAMLKKQATMDGDQGSRRSITFLDSLATGLGTHPGRKPIAYFSNGLVVPTFLDVAFEALQARANRAGVSVYGIDCKGVGGIGATANTGAFAAESSGGEARGFGLGGTLDSGAVAGGAAPADFFGIDAAVEGLRGNKQANLRVLSESTGGLLIADSNNPKPLLRQLVDDTNTYYELTYDPGIAKFDGTLRRTSVKTTAKDARVRDREGYYALKLDQQDLLPYEVRMLESLAATPLPRELEFRSGTWKVKPGSTATVAVEVPMSTLEFKEDPAKGFYLGRLAMLVQVKDPASGTIVQKFSRDIPLFGKLAQLPALKTSNFNFREQVALAPGRYIVEAVVTDRINGKTSARKTSFVGAAPAGALGLSSISVVRNFQPNAKDLNPEEPYQFQGGRIAPTLNTTMKAVKGAQMALFFTVYPDAAATDQPQAVVQYIKDGAVAGSASLELPKAVNGRIPYVLSSPLDAMPPGTYEVKITVKQGPTAAVQESVFLTIES